MTPPLPAIPQTSQEPPRTPHTVQPKAADAPPFDPDTPDNLSARKRLFPNNIDDKKETDSDSAKKTKLEQSASGIEEHYMNPTSSERSPPNNQINLPPEHHHSTKKVHDQKKK
ncbi:unnamed protein product [Urochloa humidicola]